MNSYIFGGLQLENHRGELLQTSQVCLEADEGEVEHQLDHPKCFGDAPDPSLSMSQNDTLPSLVRGLLSSCDPLRSMSLF